MFSSLYFAVLLGVCQAGDAYVPSLPNSFHFGLEPQGSASGQCDTIQIKWERGSATGPPPIPPFYVQVFTSTSNVPYLAHVGNGPTADWSVPFSVGTEYQICMYDSRSNGGGCSAIRTVIPSNQTSCQVPTEETRVLEVDASVATGRVSQCSDISIFPRSGKSPYTLTVAPASHPPWIITKDGQETFRWPVTLSWGSSLFLSLSDADGGMWSTGPIVVGEGPASCLVGDSIPSGYISTFTTITIGIGALMIGWLFGSMVSYIFLRGRQKGKRIDLSLETESLITSQHHSKLSLGSRPTHEHLPSEASSLGVSQPTTVGTTRLSYPVEPLLLPHETPLLSDQASPTPNQVYHQPILSSDHIPWPVRQDYQQQLESTPHISSQTSLAHISPILPPNTLYNRQSQGKGLNTRRSSTMLYDPDSTTTQPAPPENERMQRRKSQIYVLHHDGGSPPVTILHETGTEVVELPPLYARTREGETTSREGATAEDSVQVDGSPASSQQQSATIEQPRQAGPLPPKMRVVS